MISVGETLRRERLRRNLGLDQISSELKISAKFLEAIEEEKFDKLPAGVFARSFVRQYAHLLELDEEELASEVQRTMDPQPVNSQAARQEALPVPEIHVPRVEQWQGGAASERRFSWSSSLPALAGVVVVMLVCSFIYSLWQRSRHSVSAHEPAPVPAETAQAPPAAVPTVPEPSAAPPVTAPEQTPATPVPEGGSDSRPAEPAPKAAEPAPAQPARAAPSSGSAVRLELTAGEPVWVLAQNDGKYLFSGTLEPNQTRVVEANGTVTLRLGNAGGVNITLNGKPIGAVGPKGQVRTVQFTSGGFHIVPAPKPSAPLDDIL